MMSFNGGSVMVSFCQGFIVEEPKDADARKKLRDTKIMRNHKEHKEPAGGGEKQ